MKAIVWFCWATAIFPWFWEKKSGVADVLKIWLLGRSGSMFNNGAIIV